VAFMNYYFVRDLSRPSLTVALGLSVIASAVMAAGLLFARSLITLHVVLQIVLGALVYGAVYWAGRALSNRWQTQNR